ncbi:hypothetical protein AB9P05_09130 [Roseivirga sp. BDSF3-8]|uniref:hypothetical protein n=1 Tax=Roseivirga sp. BDSF3-8 TaxID=3241598 RepID=UPI00353209DD
MTDIERILSYFSSSFRRSYHIIYLCCIISVTAAAQVPVDVPGEPDSVRVRRSEMIILHDTLIVPYRDTVMVIPGGESWQVRPNPYYRSAALYDSLENEAGEDGITAELFRLFFRPIAQDIYRSDTIVQSEIYYEPYRRGIINQVSVEEVPIIGGDIIDTTRETKGKSFLNRVLPPTSKRLILANILFTVGDTLDPFIIADSERLLRQLPYVRDARIYVLNDLSEPGEVSATIVIQPRFPLSFTGRFDGFRNYSLLLVNRNIGGSGNQIQAGYVRNRNSQQPNGYEASFTSRNLGHSFTQVSLSLADNWLEERKLLTFSKPFISPLTEYGGGFEAGSISRRESRIYADTTYFSPVSFQFQDGWFGRAITFGQQRRRTLTGALRLGNYDFQKRPEVKADSNIRFQDRQFVLTSLTYQYRRYLKSNYIFAFGITEDLPVGYSASLIAGRDFSEFGNRPYLGGRVGWAFYYPPIGYIHFNYGMGGLRENGEWSGLANRYRVDYFMPILLVGSTRVRNFARLQVNKGVDAFAPETDELDDDIRGLHGEGMALRTLWSGSIESVWFTPGSLYGFRFAPYGFVDMGALPEDRDRPRGELYAGVGAGCRIRNESLVFRTIEFHTTLYPAPPLGGSALQFYISLSAPFAFQDLFNPKPRIEPFD